MASWGNVISQVEETTFIPPSTVLDTIRIGFVTRPSGVIGERVVPRTAWASGGAGDWIAPLANAVEDLIAGGLASYASYVQQVDPSTQLVADAFTFVVTYDPGDGRPVQEAEATIPVAALTADTQFGGVFASYFGGGSSALDPAQTLRDVYDRLVATANL